MSDPATQSSRAKTEAAGWLARLSQRSISIDELDRFEEWKRDRANAAAYADVNRTWMASRGLSADPDIRRATAETLKRRPARERTNALMRSPWLYCAVGLVAIVGVSAFFVVERPPTFTTQIGEQSVITLEDGSRVHLNTASKLVVRYRAKERRVELARGEAFFEAAHDASRPFVVVADGAQVRALGTKFDVRRDAGAVEVTLLEGRVRVAQEGHPATATLTPNQRLTVSDAGIGKPRSTDAAEDAGWTSGRLTFHAVPLEDAVAQVNRYALHKVSLDGPPSLVRAPVTGVFNTGDTDAFIAAVQGVFDLQSTKDATGAVHLGPRDAAPPA